MDRLKGWGKQLRALLRRREVERELDEELAFHLEMEAARLHREEGLSRAAARRRARLAFGGVDRFTEQVHDARWTSRLADALRELRLAVRSLGRARAFTAASVLTLAVGVGVNAAVFGLVSDTLFAPLPYPESSRLVAIQQRVVEPATAPRVVRWSYPEFEAVRTRMESHGTLTAYTFDDYNLSGAGGPHRVRAELVSASYFDVLGVRPQFGRGFVAADDTVGAAAPAVVLSHELWRRLFDGDPAVLGRTLHLSGVAVDVAGVMPPGFAGPGGPAELWVPHTLVPRVGYAEHLTTTQHFLHVVGRLHDGIDADVAAGVAATSALAAAAAARAETGALAEGEWRVRLLPLRDALFDAGAARSQLVLAGAVFFVLLLAAVNFTALQFARGVGRSREMAVRAALGAGRRRLFRQTLLESAILGAGAALLGLALAAWLGPLFGTLASPSVSALRPGEGSGYASPGLDGGTAAFAAMLSLAVALLAALLPAGRAARFHFADALRAGGRSVTAAAGSLRRPSWLSVVTVLQSAASLVLLVAAGMLLAAFQQLRAVDTGFDADGVISFRIAPAESEYAGAAAAPLLQRVLEEVQAVPGVVAATVSRCTPFMRCSSTPLYHEGAPVTGTEPIVGRNYVGPDHFRTLGIPLLRGRSLTEHDRPGQPRVAVINEAAAQQLWPGQDPIGRRVRFGSGGGFASPDSLTEVVGIVGNVPYGAPGEGIGPDFYTSYLQFVWPATMVIVRVAGEPSAFVHALRGTVSRVDANLPIYDVQTIAERSAAAFQRERFATTAVTSFAVLGLLLAGLGIFGVVSYAVARRRNEIGIRVALGARPAEVLRLVVGNAIVHAAAGLIPGMIAAVVLARGLGALVPGVAIVNPLVWSAAALLLLVVAAATAYLPARAALRVEPAETLQAQ